MYGKTKFYTSKKENSSGFLSFKMEEYETPIYIAVRAENKKKKKDLISP